MVRRGRTRPEDGHPDRGLQRGRHPGRRPRQDPGRLPLPGPGDLRLRRRQQGRHLPGGTRLQGAVAGTASHRHPPPAQPRLRRQPEGRVPHGHRARARHRRAAPRRRPVRAGVPARPDGAAGARRVRRRVRVTDATPGRGPTRGHAPLQVPRQPCAHHVRERHAGDQPKRVPLRVPGVPGGRPRSPSLRGQHRRLPLRHPDHHPAARRRTAHRRGAHPDLLRRRDLPRQRDQVRQGRGDRRRALPAGETGSGSRRHRQRGPGLPPQDGCRQLPRPHPRPAGPGAARAGARPGVRGGPGRRTAPVPRTPRGRRRRRGVGRRAPARRPVRGRRPRRRRPRLRRLRLRRGRVRRRGRAHPHPRGPAGRRRQAPAPGRRAAGQHPQLRPLVPTRAGRRRSLRLRPAGHPRRHPPSVLHPEQLRAAGPTGRVRDTPRRSGGHPLRGPRLPWGALRLGPVPSGSGPGPALPEAVRLPVPLRVGPDGAGGERRPGPGRPRRRAGWRR